MEALTDKVNNQGEHIPQYQLIAAFHTTIPT